MESYLEGHRNPVASVVAAEPERAEAVPWAWAGVLSQTGAAAKETAETALPADSTFGLAQVGFGGARLCLKTSHIDLAGTREMRLAGFEPATRGLEVRRSVH
jgi:hypothetical protein